MKISSLLEVLAAACLAWTVKWEFEQTGGIFLCAPTGQLKTSMLTMLESIPGVRGVSDLTSRDLSQMHDDIESKRIRTLMFYELPKLYERRSETAANILGHIRSLIDEGFTGISSESGGMRSRCVVLAAMPLAFQRRHIDEWRDNGLARRVLLAKFRLNDPSLIDRAIIKGEKIKFGTGHFIAPLDEIKMSVTMAESYELAKLLRDQAGTGTPLVMLKKIVSVLRWKYRQMHRPDVSMQIVHDFGRSLSTHGDELYLEEPR